MQLRQPIGRVLRRPLAARPVASDDLRREVLRLGLPAVTERILSLLVSLVNGVLVGHLGAAALAAVGLSGNIEMIGMTFLQAVSTGTTSLVAQSVGANNRALAQRVFEQSMLVGIAMGLACLALLLPTSRWALIAMGAEPETVTEGMRYLPYLAGTLPLMSMLTVGNAALRGAGDTKTPMYIMGAMNVLNAALSWVLIRGWGPISPMGVLGAGIAAAVSRSLAGLAVVMLLFSHHSPLPLKRLLNRPDRDILRRLLDVGLPAGGENLLMRVAFLTYTRAIASLGTVAYAAYTIASRVEHITMMPAFGFSVAATTLAGQSLGAGDIQRARRSVFRSIEIAMGVSFLGAAIFVGFPRAMLSIFTNDQAIIAQGILPLQILAAGQPLMAVAQCLSGGLRGSGDTRSTMWVTGIGGWLVRIPLTLLAVLVFRLGLPGVQIAMTLDWVVRTMLYLWRFRPVTWAERARRAAAAVHQASHARARAG
ncbi:MAG: MATE family efflux transporter [Anaerolineae bacterium]|nr:MATE family efflux transporter [Anaerolineae bacterium]